MPAVTDRVLWGIDGMGLIGAHDTRKSRCQLKPSWQDSPIQSCAWGQ
jgi:hypothetical protein